jgi:hypothetical protein
MTTAQLHNDPSAPSSPPPVRSQSPGGSVRVSGRKGRAGRPLGGPPRQIVVQLPEGMSNEILAWACGISPTSKTIYRWRTGVIPLPSLPATLIKLWERIGQDRFMALMARVWGDRPPERRAFKSTRGRKPTYADAIITVLAGSMEPLSLDEIVTAVREDHGFKITKGSVKTILWRIKRKGAVTSPRHGFWQMGKRP